MSGSGMDAQQRRPTKMQQRSQRHSSPQPKRKKREPATPVTHSRSITQPRSASATDARTNGASESQVGAESDGVQRVRRVLQKLAREGRLEFRDGLREIGVLPTTEFQM